LDLAKGTKSEVSGQFGGYDILYKGRICRNLSQRTIGEIQLLSSGEGVNKFKAHTIHYFLE